MKEFSKIEKLVFGKQNDIETVSGLYGAELHVCTALLDIKNRFEQGEIEKEKATEEKTLLKGEYENFCNLHKLIIEMESFMAEGVFSATKDKKLIDYMLTKYSMLSDKADEYGVPIFRKLMVVAFEYVEERIREVSE